jgi:hypothetical protein
MTKPVPYILGTGKSIKRIMTSLFQKNAEALYKIVDLIKWGTSAYFYLGSSSKNPVST